MRIRPLPDLRREAGKRRIPVWLVGGAVRDLLLSLPHPDLDIAVPRGAADVLASELSARGLGTVVLLSESSPRVVRLAGRGRLELDLAEIEGESLVEDLARRDFTANAMAVELSTGALVDPFGGREDLRRRRLRLVRPGNLEEDPLRVLRAARFMGTHGLRPDRALSAACRSASSGLSRAAPERIASELSRLLEAPRCAPALSWAASCGVLGPALDRRIPRGFSPRLPRLDAPPIAGADPSRRRIRRLALLGDALGMTPEEIGRWLSGRRFSREDARRAGRILELARGAQKAAPGKDWEWVVAAGEEADDARRVASVLSHRGRAASRRLSRKLRRPRPRLKVSGADLLAWTGLGPGPEIGRLLGRLEVEIRRGAVKSRREARSWALSAATATSPGPPTR